MAGTIQRAIDTVLRIESAGIRKGADACVVQKPSPGELGKNRKMVPE